MNGGTFHNVPNAKSCSYFLELYETQCYAFTHMNRTKVVCMSVLECAADS